MITCLFLWSHKIFRGIVGAAEALFEGIWMGLLTERMLDAISLAGYGKGVDFTSLKHLEKGLYFPESIALQQHFLPGTKILVAAAGGGRELVALVRSGFRADGFDCCLPMVDAGRTALKELGICSKLDWAPPCRVPATPADYTGLMVGWSAYGYLCPRPRRIAFLRELSSRALPGSPIFLSGAARNDVARLPLWAPAIANFVRRLALRPPIFEAGDRFPGKPTHFFAHSQIERELTEAGFRLVGFYKWIDHFAAVGLKQAEFLINCN